jgi:hypothetical protein
MNTASYISIAISLLVVGFNAAMFVVIKFNDLKHLTKDVEEIKTDVKSLLEYQHSIDKRVVRLETKFKSHRNRDL